MQGRGGRSRGRSPPTRDRSHPAAGVLGDDERERGVGGFVVRREGARGEDRVDLAAREAHVGVGDHVAVAALGVAAGLDVLLLLFVIGVWVNTYREIKAPFTLASMVFGGFPLAGNVVALLFYFNAPAMPTVAVRVMMVLQILETAGISVLAYVTWQ